MIIIQNPTKDTYVTDIEVGINKGIDANVGQSSTLDLFKVASENSNSRARALIEIVTNPNDGDTITLIDSSGTSKTFEYDDNTVVVNGNVSIAIANDLATTLNNTINIINAVLDFDITSSKLYSNIILLKQVNPGVSGDTAISVVAGERIKSKDFIRFEHSACLIEFNLEDLKDKHLSAGNIVNSVFNSKDDFRAYINLRDVGKSSTRPNDFKLKLGLLESSFKEGLGRDVVHFSDLDDANFKTIDSKNSLTWTNEGIVSEDDLFVDTLNPENTSFEFYFENGTENLKIDITNYLHEYFKETANYDKSSFVLYFDNDYLFDIYTYFVKRFGSRNLKNKSNIPQLQLYVKDTKIENVIIEKKRYFNNEENFFLFNTKGNTLKSFIDAVDVKLDVTYSDSSGSDLIDLTYTGSSIYNYKGDKVTGIKKFLINDSDITQQINDTAFQSNLERFGYNSLNFRYYYDDGAIETLIKNETVKFYLPESDINEISFSNRNIRVSIDLLQRELKADNSTISLKTSFVDINKQYKSVNVASQLYSEDLGFITYEMYDVDSGMTLIENNDEFTLLNFNGKHYILNLFATENFINKRVNFKFKYKDPITGLSKIVANDNITIRFVQ
jgi:hypothetical protein